MYLRTNIKNGFGMSFVLLTKKLGAKDFKGVLKEIGNYLYAKKMVNEGFTDSIIKREKEFPTGLELPFGVNVAIPHTDREYVNTPALLIGIPSDPVEFHKMDDPKEKIKTALVLVLVIRDPKGYVKFLSKLTNLFKKKEFSNMISEKRYGKFTTELEKIAESTYGGAVGDSNE